MVVGEVEVIHGSCDIEIGVGVEACDKALSLVVEIGFDFEIGVEAVADIVSVA